MYKRKAYGSSEMGASPNQDAGHGTCTCPWTHEAADCVTRGKLVTAGPDCQPLPGSQSDPGGTDTLVTTQDLAGPSGAGKIPELKGDCIPSHDGHFTFYYENFKIQPRAE